jgi:hypothetical protein
MEKICLLTNGGLIRVRRALFEPELLSYEFAETVPDFPVPGDWRPASVFEVEEDVVSPARTMKLTPSLLEFPDELLAVQTLDLDFIRLDWSPGGWLLVFLKQVVGLPDVLLELS